MKTPLVEKGVKLTMKDLYDGARQLQKELGRKPTVGEAMTHLCMRQLINDLAIMSEEGPELAKSLEMADRRNSDGKERHAHTG
jgi:type II secretory pathway component PulF